MAPLSLVTSLSVIALWNREEDTQSAFSVRLGTRDAGYHASLGSLLDGLRGSMPTRGEYGLEYEEHLLRFASSLWLPKGTRIDQHRARALAKPYGTKVHRRVHERPARAALAVSHQMRQGRRVRMRLGREVFADPRAFVVASSIDFEAEWDLMFVGGMTGTFHVDGKAEAVATPRMQQVLPSDFYAGVDVYVSEVFYRHKDSGASLAMTFVVPKAVDGLAQLEAGLTVDRLERWIAAMEEGTTKAAVHMPPWTAKYAPDYRAALQRMGLAPDEALGASALHVRHAFGQAEIEVNEYGTRATETNLVGGVLGGMGGPLQALHLDRPFLYLIRDTRSGVIMFIGRVTDPRS
jgi:serpin B